MSRQPLQNHDTLPAWYPYRRTENDGSPDPTKGAAWSGREPPPAIGDTVHVFINMIGPSRVVGYFTEDGFLGILALPIDPPIWYAEQNGIEKPCHVFGAEIDTERKAFGKQEGRYRRARVLKKWRLALAARDSA